jgi:cell division protein FtsW
MATTTHGGVLEDQRQPEEDAPLVPPTEAPPEGRPFDAPLLALVIALVGLGLVMVYSASAVQMPWRGLEHAFYLKRQLVHVAVGLGAMLVALRVDYRWWRQRPYLILGATLATLLMVLVFGVERNGAQRWFSLFGFSLQPAEVLKVVMVLYMGYSLEKKEHKLKEFSIGIIPHLMVLGVVAALLLMQPDFGSTVICAAVVFGMLFVAGARPLYIAAIGGFGVLLGALAVLSSAYRRQRLLAYLCPEDPEQVDRTHWLYQHCPKDMAESAYQINQSLMTIGSGGALGKGLGAGHGKLGYVPEMWNDFIGTAIGEELGLVGLGLVCALFVGLMWRGLTIAWGARDMYGVYVAFGLTMLLGLQAAVNLSVVTGVLPNKGLTLPFVSYGGSAMIMSMFAVGVMLNISMAREDRVTPALEARRAVQEQERLVRRDRDFVQRRLKR